MKSVYRAVGALCLAAFATPSMAEPLTTDSIVSLAKTGVGEDAIIAKIKSENQRFNLSVEDMIALKDKGVSSAVIAAMIAQPAAVTPQLSLDSPDPMIPHPASVYLMDGSGKMAKMNPTVSNQAKTDEYGLIFALADTGTGGAMTARIFDFSVQ